jgi:hypothetical protein
MTEPKVSREEMLDWLDGYGREKYKPRNPMQSEPPNEKMRKAIRAAIEERGRLREFIMSCKEVVEEAFYTEDVLTRHLMLKNLANAVRDLKLDGEEKK